MGHAEQTDARIVEEVVEGALGGVDLLDHRLHGGAVGHIQLSPLGLPALLGDGLDGLLKAVDVDVYLHHAGALSGQLDRQGLSDARGVSRDQRALVAVHRHGSSLHVLRIALVGLRPVFRRQSTGTFCYKPADEKLGRP